MAIGRQKMHRGEWNRDPIEMSMFVPVGVSKPRVLIQRPGHKMLNISPLSN